MATFTAFAIAAFLPGGLPPGFTWLDHTYIATDDNFVWGCFGRSSGGRAITADNGNSLVADCLSKPIDNSVTPQIYAGLRYGRTGVCHQAANRILSATGSGITVAAARGARLSFARWGVFGTSPWPQRAACAKLTGGSGGGGAPSGSGSSGGGSNMNQQNKDAQFAHRIRSIYTPEVLDYLGDQERFPDWQLRERELKALVDTYLGENYDRKKVRAVIGLHLCSQWEQDSLGLLLDEDELTPERYLNAFNTLAVSTAKICEQILGSEDFERLFGCTPDEAAGLINPETLLSDRKSAS